MIALAHLRSALLNSLYAPRCVACDAKLQIGLGLCASCIETCESIGAACSRCARPMPANVTSTNCIACASGRSPLTSCTACFEYGGQIAVALRRLKFSGRNDIAKSLRCLVQERFNMASRQCDLAVAIPLHRVRLRKRGFNQAQRLLAPLAASAGIPEARSRLWRVRETPAQSRLSRAQRRANLQGAFQADGKVQGKRILLLDDIRTTGATLEAGARALLRAGAREIHGFVVARTEWEG